MEQVRTQCTCISIHSIHIAKFKFLAKTICGPFCQIESRQSFLQEYFKGETFANLVVHQKFLSTNF